MPPRVLQWLSLVGIIWLQSINGTNFNFPSYSSQLKHLLSISQFQLNNLAFASDAGKLVGWFSGVATVYLPLWLVLMIGSTLGLIGYGVQYLIITEEIGSVSYWQIFLLSVIAGNSICWINTVCYIVAIRNFPSNQQVAVGISTSYQGLSAKIYTDFVDTLFSSSPIQRAKAFLLLNSVLPLVVSVIASILAREVDVPKSRKMEGGFVVIFVITIATGIFTVISSLGSVSSGLSSMSGVIGIGVLLFLPLMVPIAEEVKEIVGKYYDANRERRVCHYIIEKNVGVERMEEIGGIENGVKEELGGEGEMMCVIEEIGVRRMVKKVDFWLYFFVYFLGATIGLVFLNNLGQIAESRQSSRVSSLISLSSSFGFFGRLVPSLFDYFFSRNKYGISRPASIVALMGPMAGAFFLLLSPTNLSLYMSTAIIGVCAGAITSISVATTTELFGTKNLSINHNVVVANIPIGSFLFGYLASFFYHRHENEAGKCFGMECYSNTFVIWGSLCFLGTILALVLYFRTRKFYSQQI